MANRTLWMGPFRIIVLCIIACCVLRVVCIERKWNNSKHIIFQMLRHIRLGDEGLRAVDLTMYSRRRYEVFVYGIMRVQ